MEKIEPLYVTFVRHPVDKYVSGKLFANKHENWSFQQAVDAIADKIQKNNNHYDGYSKYLLTPEQKESTELREMSEKVQAMKSNLAQNPVLIGVLEEMTDSLNLIRYVINHDADPKVNRMLDMLDTSAAAATPSGKDDEKGSTTTTTTPRSIRNKSKLSTSKIVQELQKNETLFEKLQHLLRYDFELYDFAKELHARQVQYLLEQQGKGRTARV